MKKDEHIGGPFDKPFEKSISLSRDVLETQSTSWRVRTGKRYSFHIERFVKFCREIFTDLNQATTKMGIEFLTEYFKTGVGYSSANSARSA